MNRSRIPERNAMNGTQDTESGLRIYAWAFMLVIVSSVVSLISAAATIPLLQGAHSWQDTDVRTSRTVSSISGIVTLILSILAIILYLLASEKMYRGKEWSGTKHSRNVTIGLIFLGISIFITIPYAASSFIFAVKTNMTASAMRDTFLRYTIASSVLGFLYYAFISLFLIFMVRSILGRRAGKPLQYSAFLLLLSQTVCTAVLFSYYAWLSTPSYADVNAFTLKIYQASSIASLGQILSLGGFALFLRSFQRASIRARAERTGLLDRTGAKKEKVIFAEPAELVERERKTAQLYVILTVAGVIALFAASAYAAVFYNALFWSWAFLIIMAMIFCFWEMYVWLEQYLTRTRFRVYEDSLVPSYIPVSYALNRREYLVPFSRLKGLSLAKRERKDGSVEWRCDFLLDDGRPVEFHGTESEIGFYKFLSRIKGDFNLGDYSFSEEPADIRSRFSKEYREQLRRWGIKPKDKAKRK